MVIFPMTNGSGRWASVRKRSRASTSARDLKGEWIWGKREDLIRKSAEFLRTIKDKTPGAETEKWLNNYCGPTSETYQELAKLIKQSRSAINGFTTARTS
jgi:hypothetical protein